MLVFTYVRPTVRVSHFDAVLHATGDPLPFLLPVVDRVRECCDCTLQDRLATLLLTDSAVRHHDLRPDCELTNILKESEYIFKNPQ